MTLLILTCQKLNILGEKINTKASLTSSSSHPFTNAFNNLVISQSNSTVHGSVLNCAMTEDDDEDEDTSSEHSDSEDVFFPFIKSTGHLKLNSIPVDSWPN